MFCGDVSDYGTGQSAVDAYNACIAAARVEVAAPPTISQIVYAADQPMPLGEGCTYTYEPFRAHGDEVLVGPGDYRREGNLSAYGMEQAWAWFTHQQTCPAVALPPIDQVGNILDPVITWATNHAVIIVVALVALVVLPGLVMPERKRRK